MPLDERGNTLKKGNPCLPHKQSIQDLQHAGEEVRGAEEEQQPD